MTDQIDRKVVDDIGEGREVEDVLGDAVERAGRPGAIAVPAQIERIDVKVLTQCARNPVPTARVIKPAVDEN
jgi:hypothetical protein